MGAFQDKEKLLKDAGIEVTLLNNDQHFICFKNGAFVDYWPKTGVEIDIPACKVSDFIKSPEWFLTL